MTILLKHECGLWRGCFMYVSKCLRLHISRKMLLNMDENNYWLVFWWLKAPMPMISMQDVSRGVGYPTLHKLLPLTDYFWHPFPIWSTFAYVGFFIIQRHLLFTIWLVSVKQQLGICLTADAWMPTKVGPLHISMTGKVQSLGLYFGSQKERPWAATTETCWLDDRAVSLPSSSAEQLPSSPCA